MKILQAYHHYKVCLYYHQQSNLILTLFSTFFLSPTFNLTLALNHNLTHTSTITELVQLPI